jgi:hypothetical protein
MEAHASPAPDEARSAASRVRRVALVLLAYLI